MMGSQKVHGAPFGSAKVQGLSMADLTAHMTGRPEKAQRK